MKAVKFLQSALEDIRREKNYYRKIDVELARRFQASVEAAVKAAATRQLAMQVLEPETFRRWPLETFPHGILYRDEDDFILVLAVFHPKQEPEKWQERARE